MRQTISAGRIFRGRAVGLDRRLFLPTALLAGLLVLGPAYAEDGVRTLQPIDLEPAQADQAIVFPSKPKLAQADMAAIVPRNNANDIPELVTDRPDITEAAIVVPKGSLQVENGFTYENDSGGTRNWNGTESLFRLGLTDRVELRWMAPQYFITRGTTNTSGFGDLYVGSKIQLGPLPGGFELALMPGLNLPTGANSISSNHVDPELKMLWSHDLGKKWEIGGLFGVFWPSDPGGANRTFSFQSAIMIDYDFTERFSTFTEYVVELPSQGGDVHFLHQGWMYLLSPRQQLDFHYGVGLSAAAPDYFIGAGYTFRVDGLF